jgi:hypothetical protein
MEQHITLKYKSVRSNCHCCGQSLGAVKWSDYKEFDFDKDSIDTWSNWREYVDDPDVFAEEMKDYAYTTIFHWAVDSNDNIHIDESEFDKLKEYILKEFC